MAGGGGPCLLGIINELALGVVASLDADMKLNRKILPVKPWQRLGISKEMYLKARPWKKLKWTREKYEAAIMSADQDLINETKFNFDTNLLLEKAFGQEAMER